ncbi:MAG: hypothetical protein FVQ84_12515 [Planctomycetes bacterium]|nr:hypothetical protein [Planctomycetota bacterium]
MATITKKELIDRITENTQAKRLLVKATIQNFLDEVISELPVRSAQTQPDYGHIVPGSNRNAVNRAG